jgi:hypothetical protein
MKKTSNINKETKKWEEGNKKELWNEQESSMKGLEDEIKKT